MSDASDNPDLAEALRLILRHRDSRLWTALPGVVRTYDANTQRADVKPAVVGFLQLTEGEEEEELPVIPNVPVVLPSGGGFFCSFPLQAGDPVVLIFACRDIGPWKAGEGGVANAQDNRMHDLTDAFAVPGGRAKGNALAGASAEDLVIGKDGGGRISIAPGGTISADPGDGAFVELAGAAAFLARADLVDARVDAIEAWAAVVVAIYNAHAHLVDTLGVDCSSAHNRSPSQAPQDPITALPPLLTVACDKVKGT